MRRFDLLTATAVQKVVNTHQRLRFDSTSLDRLFFDPLHRQTPAVACFRALTAGCQGP